MNVEDCMKEDGGYFLLECGDRLSEFELIIKDGKTNFKEIQIQPFKELEINDNDFNLICDLHESNNWISYKQEQEEIDNEY